MFEDLAKIFRNSFAAFRTELHRNEPEDQVAELLTAMRREWVAARAELPVIVESLERTRTELRREREAVEQCERRGRLAEGIGDAETVRVAAEFATRHRAKVTVLEQKVAAVEAEHTLRVSEIEEMKQRYQQADSNRFQLLAEIRRRQSQSRLRTVGDEADASFTDWDRMREKIDDTDSYASALDELNSDLDGGPPPRSPDPGELDERLRELKRRMGKE
jgi:phage shock protein A